MKKKFLRIGIIILSVLLLVVVILGVVFRNEIRTLASLEQVDDYGMFQMTYHGDYGFDDFLEVGASNDGDIEAFVTQRLLKGIPLDLGVTGGGCTVFVTQNDKGEIIFGRNFDFAYSPSLQVFTAPDTGYASVSTVNLSFAGYDEDRLPKGLSLNSFLSLAAPYLPFDGMNEKGLAIALLAVPEADGGYDPEKVTLNTTTAIRLVLDKAATVDEAVKLLENYNIYFSGGVECHYLIAEASGKSAIVEYYDGAMRVVGADGDYQIASNFIAYNNLNIGEGFDEFERYDKVKAAIEDSADGLSHEQAIELLAQVGVMDGELDKLQWSVIYNLTTGEASLFANRKPDNIVYATLELNR